MNENAQDIEDLQREVAGLLLDHVYASLLEDQHVRGVLPAPSRAPAVRVVLGDRNECVPSRLTAYEIPLGAGEELRTAHDVVALLRAVHTGTHIYSSDRVTSVMGMDLYLIDPAQVEEAPFTTETGLPPSCGALPIPQLTPSRNRRRCVCVGSCSGKGACCAFTWTARRQWE